jgi:hypothetical protein
MIERKQELKTLIDISTESQTIAHGEQVDCSVRDNRRRPSVTFVNVPRSTSSVSKESSSVRALSRFRVLAWVNWIHFAGCPSQEKGEE